MRVTVRLNDYLEEDIRKMALEKGCTLSQLVNDLLREALAYRDKLKNRPSVELLTFKGDGLQPGISMEHWGEFMEQLDDLDGVNDKYRKLTKDSSD
jgi:hypothetical protein